VVDGGLMAVGPGITTRTGFSGAPKGWSGANRGTTGEKAVVRKRGEGA